MNATARPVCSPAVRAAAGAGRRLGAIAHAVASAGAVTAAVAIGSALALVTAPAHAQSPSSGTPLTPQAARITDEAIQTDHQTYDRMQARIKALNDGGRRVADYHLSKAQCWLDVSFHEYTRNDRSAFPQAALDEAGKLVDAMERKASPLPMDTPLVNGAARLRPDLWAAIGNLQTAAGFRCVQQAVACAEVELVHAGNEYNQQQWRHAAPYIQIAEDLVSDATTRAASCPGAVAPATAPVAAAPVPPPVQPAVAAPMAFVVFFAFDQFGIADIDSASQARLKALVQMVARERAAVGSIRLVGYADRLNRTGHGDYNLRLSEKRVTTVRNWLVQAGVDASLIETAARGAADPLVQCGDEVQPSTRLESCLAPDRRVEITVTPPRAR